MTHASSPMTTQLPAGDLSTGLVENAALSHYAHEPAAADLVIDVSEHRRRSAAARSVFADADTLDQLWNFPHGIEIGWQDLTSRETAFVQARAVDAFTRTVTGVTRVLRPVATVTQVVVRRTVQALDCVDTAAAFTAYAPTILHLTHPSSGLDDDLDEARYHGIGVQIGPLHAPRLLLPPAPRRQHRHVTAKRWAFTERAYAAWLNTATDLTHPDYPYQPSAATSAAVAAERLAWGQW